MTRKHSRRKMTLEHHATSNPFLQAGHELMLKRLLADLQTEAGLQVYMGGNAKTIIRRAGKLCFVADSCATESGIDPQHPDVRIIAGMASTLLDLSRPGQDVERHRGALRSGLAACQRILASADPWTAGKALLLAEDYIHRPEAMAQAVQQAEGASA